MPARTPHAVAADREDGAEPCARAEHAHAGLRGDRAVGPDGAGRQVVWTRVLSLLFGATAYTFSLILAVFLVGLGIGSSLGAALARTRTERRGSRSAGARCGCARALAWAAYSTARRCRIWPINPSDLDGHRLQLPARSDARASGSCCRARSCGARAFRWRWRRSRTRGQDPARLVGGVYAANTVGAIVGALVTGLILVGTFGSQVAQQILIGVALLSGLLMLVPVGSEMTGRARTRAW